MPDEQEVRKFESLQSSKVDPQMLTNEICSKSSMRTTFELLRNNDKTIENYELLVFRDGLLEFRSLEFGSVKYLG